MCDFSAIIPVRETISTHFKTPKDILPFGESNLLSHKIQQLKKIEGLNIIVCTESDNLAAIAAKENVTTVIRPPEFSDNTRKFSEFVTYVCDHVETEHVIWSCVTSPLVDTDLYCKAISLYKKALGNGYDSLVSVQKLQRYLLDLNGALNFRPGRQFKTAEELAPLYIFTNGISIAPRLQMKKRGYTSGDIPFLFELGKREAIDICDEYDYECAQYFYNHG